MTKRQLNSFAKQVERRLNNDLDFDLCYDIDYYHEDGASIVDIDIDAYCDDVEDWPDDWDCQVEDVIDDIMENWYGWYSWNGWCLSISLPDDC